MNGPVPNHGRLSGTQGTRLFTAEELREYAVAFSPPVEDRASAAQPVLAGRGEGFDRLRFPLRTGRLTIGRRSDNDIVLDDPSVSASHAWLINQQGHYVIMNTLSTNGVFVNGKRVHEAILRHGDRIRLGQAEFVFLTREGGVGRLGRLAWLVAGLALLGGLAALGWWLH